MGYSGVANYQVEEYDMANDLWCAAAWGGQLRKRASDWLACCWARRGRRSAASR